MRNLILCFLIILIFLIFSVTYTQSLNNPQLKWKIATKGYSLNPPLIINNTVYFESSFEDTDGEICAVDIHSAKLKWKVNLPEDGYFSNLIHRDSTLYLGSGDAVFAFNAITGEIIWKVQDKPRFHASPFIVGDEIIFGGTDSLYVFDIKTGKYKWSYGRKNKWKTGPREPHTSTDKFKVINGNLYIAFQHYESVLCAVDLASKIEKWAYDINTEGGLQFDVSNKFLFCALWRSGDLITLDIKTGLEKWRIQTSAMGFRGLVYGDGVVYALDGAGLLFALDAETGKLKWQYQSNKWSTCNPTYDNGIIYLGLAGGKVVAVDAYTGKQIWEFDGKPPTARSFIDYVTISNNMMFFNINKVIYAVDLKPEPGLEDTIRQPYLISLNSDTLQPQHRQHLEEYIQTDLTYPREKPLLTASSTLAPYKSIQYDVSQLRDGSFETAWVEGTDGYGIGEFLEFTYDRISDSSSTYMITRLEIINGYRKNNKIWEANSRVKTLKMYLNDEPYALIELQDTPQIQVVDLDRIDLIPLKITTVKLEILDVYKGSKYKDTAISELLFNIEKRN